MTDHMLRFWQSVDSKDPFDALFLAAPILLHSLDNTGRFTRVSEFWTTKLGYKRGEMLNQRMTNFMTPSSRTFAEEISLPAFHQQGNSEGIEYDFVCKDGGILAVVMSAIAEYDETGVFTQSLAISFENSKAKQTALELQRKHQVDATGEFVSGMAHDFNSLMAVIQGNLHLLENDPDDPDRKDFIRDAVDASQRGRSLIEQLLTYGRRAKLSPTPLDLNKTVATTQRLAERLFPSNIELEIMTGDALWPSHADAALLESALLNILNNAKDAMPSGGKITVETENLVIESGFTDSTRDHVEPGQYVMISVSDTGHGMDERLVSKAFEPFFTTKPSSQGSGLGLSMVAGFIRQSKGAITIKSTPGVGTKVHMCFPVELADTGPLNAQTDASHALDKEKKVLIVEDDPTVRTVLARQLKGERLEVFEADTGDVAVKSMESGLQPDLLLTDIVMPGMIQGPELAKKARAMLPDLRVLFMSGYPMDMSHHATEISPTDKQLMKPVSQERLVAAVMELLVEN